MRLTDDFQQNIADTFYDKVFIKCDVTRTQASDGAIQVAIEETEETFTGNTRYSGLDDIKETYGIKEEIEVAITTNDNVPNEQVFSFSGAFYEVIKSLPSDSHYLLVAKKWVKA